MTDNYKRSFGSAKLPMPRIKEFFLGRQPILTRDGRLFAYELLFRSAATGPAGVVDDLAASAAVIAHAGELGIANVIGASLAFINVNAALLYSDVIEFLPTHMVILELLETVEVDDALLARMAYLVEAGYRFALDDVVEDSPRIQRLLPLVDIVKVDVEQISNTQLRVLAASVNAAGRKLLAEKVETREQFALCKELGFDYFQGFYFAKPSVLTGHKIAPVQSDLMRMLSNIDSNSAISEIESAIKQDTALGLALLRLVNAATSGLFQPSATLAEAMETVGRERLLRWMQIMVYADPNDDAVEASPLLVLASTRGKLLELMARELEPNDSSFAEKAFTVGVTSLADVLFDAPMEKVLAPMASAEDVWSALVYRSGRYGELLRLVEYAERVEEMDTDVLAAMLREVGLSLQKFNALQMDAFEWSSTAVHLK